MITVNSNGVTIKGNVFKIMDELLLITNSVKEALIDTVGKDRAKELLEDMFKVAMMSEEETGKALEQELGGLDEEMKKFFKDFALRHMFGRENKKENGTTRE